jgi:hypothetical protein
MVAAVASAEGRLEQALRIYKKPGQANYGDPVGSGTDLA